MLGEGAISYLMKQWKSVGVSGWWTCVLAFPSCPRLMLVDSMMQAPLMANNTVCLRRSGAFPNTARNSYPSTPYFLDVAAIERAAKKIAKEETDGEPPSPSILNAVVKQVQDIPLSFRYMQHKM